MPAPAVEAPAPQPEAPPTLTRSSLTLELPLLYQRLPAMPWGFGGDSLLEPFDLVFVYDREPPEHRVVLEFGANASFPRYSATPALGITPGISMIVKPLRLYAGLDLQDQRTVSKPPFQGSQFDTWIWSVLASARYPALPWLNVGIDGRYAVFLKTQLADLEGLETDVDHQNTLILSPWVEVLAPFGILARAQLDFDQLGAVAIASKEFALGIQSQTVERLVLSLSKTFGEWGVNARYAWVSGYRDAIELTYQAPFYYRDYLLSPQTFSLGVTWYF